MLPDAQAFIRYDQKSSVVISVPNTLTGSVSGLCGNYDANPSNDLMDSDDKLVDDDVTGHTALGNSWKVIKENEPVCANARVPPSPVCISEVNVDSLAYCGFNIPYDGAPLTECIQGGRLNIVDYVDNCLLDVCANELIATPEEISLGCLQNGTYVIFS